jgi:hypothetical protein
VEILKAKYAYKMVQNRRYACDKQVFIIKFCNHYRGTYFIMNLLTSLHSTVHTACVSISGKVSVCAGNKKDIF